MDIARTFANVWPKGKIHKVEQHVIKKMCRVYDVNAGVPQESILRVLLYLLYTSHIPKIEDITITLHMILP